MTNCHDTVIVVRPNPAGRGIARMFTVDAGGILVIKKCCEGVRLNMEIFLEWLT